MRKALIYYSGTCKQCHQIVSTPVSVEIDDNQLPESCPYCGGSCIDWKNYSHSYHPPRPRKKTLWIILALLALLVLCTILLLCYVSRPYSSQKMSEAIHESNSTSITAILEEFQTKLSDDQQAKLLHTSKYTIKRIREEQSVPVYSFVSIIRSAYTEYLLLNKHKLLFLLRLKTHPGITDQWYPFPDPTKELQ